MSDLAHRLGEAVDALAGRPATTQDRISNQPRVPAHIKRAVREGVAVEEGRGLVQAARVRALDYVSTEAMQAVAGLTELETLYLSRAPIGEGRYRAIADTAAVTLANIVTETGRA